MPHQRAKQAEAEKQRLLAEKLREKQEYERKLEEKKELKGPARNDQAAARRAAILEVHGRCLGQPWRLECRMLRPALMET